MANEVVVSGESGNLAIVAIPTNGGADMEFASGSFKGTVDERRVVHVFLSIPGAGQTLTLRLEFTDPGFATADLFGVPAYLSELRAVDPYREPRETRRLEEGR